MKIVEIKESAGTFYLPADHILAAYSAVSRDETRYYLDGILCETTVDGHVLMTATDGHVLMHCAKSTDGAFIGADVCDQGEPDRRGFILQCDVADKAFKVKSDSSLWVYGDIETGILQFVDCDGVRRGVLEFTRVDGTFPDYRRVFPETGADYTAINLNPRKVRQLSDGFAKLDNTPRDFPILFESWNCSAPVKLTSSFAENWTGLIMPMR